MLSSPATSPHSSFSGGVEKVPFPWWWCHHTRAYRWTSKILGSCRWSRLRNRRREATIVVEKWSKPAQLVLRAKESSFGTTKLCICWKSFQHHEEFLYQPTRCSPRADCWSFSDALLQPEPEKQASRCLMRGCHQTQSYWKSVRHQVTWKLFCSLCVYITMFCSCHSDRLFVDQVKWKEPLILSLDFDK